MSQIAGRRAFLGGRRAARVRGIGGMLGVGLPLAVSLALPVAGAEPVEAGEGQGAAAFRLPPMMVRAERVEAPVQDVPVSVTAVDATTIREAGVRYVKDASIYAPNVFLTEFTARKLSNPRFRGIGSSPANPGVTTYLDGVPQLNANSSSLELVDVEQIELVRGPQGALYGRNTVGGLIHVTSRRPSTTDWRGEVTTDFGNYDLTDLRLSLSGPIVQDRLGFGVAGGYSAREGYTKNTVTGNDIDQRSAFFGKGQFLWTPAEQWEVRLIVSGERARDGDYALGDLASIRQHPFEVSRDYEGFTDRDVVGTTLIAEHRGDVVDVSSISGGVWWQTTDATDLDYTPLPLITRNNEEEDFQFTQEFRFASAKESPVTLGDALQLRWQAGVFLFTQNYDQDAVNHYAPGLLYQPDQYGPGIPPTASPANAQHSPQSALDDVGVGVYGQATLTAWEKLDLILGVRGDYEDKDADLNSYFVTPDPFLGPPSHVKASDDFTSVSPQFGLGWHLSESDYLYGSITRGYKAGGFNPSPRAGNVTYDEESSWNYEIGVKTSWFGDRLRANAALFYTDWEDLQLNVPTGAPGEFYVSNVGDAYIPGAELELTGRVLAGWDVFAGAGLQDGRFQAGSTDYNSATGTAEDIGGNKLPYTPDFTINGGTQFSIPLCSRVSVYARAEVVAYGSFDYDAINGAGQDAYSLANFRAGLRGDHWFIEGWARNAFDTDYVPLAFQYAAFAPSGYVGENGAPVTFGVRGGLHF